MRVSISSSCAISTPPTNVLAVIGCNYAEVTWGASTFISETIIHNHSVMYQWMNGGAPMTGYTSSTNIALQNLQPNAMYTVSVAGINSSVSTSEFTNNTFHLQGSFKFMDCHVAVYYCPYTHINCIASLLKASVLQILCLESLRISHQTQRRQILCIRN